MYIYLHGNVSPNSRSAGELRLKFSLITSSRPTAPLLTTSSRDLDRFQQPRNELLCIYDLRSSLVKISTRHSQMTHDQAICSSPETLKGQSRCSRVSCSSSPFCYAWTKSERSIRTLARLDGHHLTVRIAHRRASTFRFYHTHGALHPRSPQCSIRPEGLPEIRITE
jgi:hypothetical protein